MARVVVVGDAMLDVVTRPEGPVAPTSDTPSRTRVGRGGSGANVAAALAGGHEVLYVAAIGEDDAGELVERALRAEGVEPRLERHAGATGVVVSIVAPDSQRAMLTDRGVNPLLTLDHVRSALEGSDHLHLSGYTLLDPATRALASRALGLAREAGASTSLDACSAEPLARLGAGAFLEAGRDARWLFANEEEATLLDPAGPPFASLAQRCEELVVTRGPAGAMARRAGSLVEVPARSHEALDSTGAGDAATGAYLSARLAGEDPLGALEVAMEAAARVVARLGAGQSRL